MLHLSGAIVENTEQSSGIEAEEVVQVMQEFAQLEAIKAVVIAVNSPGGSATASDRIARGVQQLRQKKPVVISTYHLFINLIQQKMCWHHIHKRQALNIYQKMGLI